MWWVDSIRTRWTGDAPLIALALFRLGFAACCLMKFTTETTRGYFRYFQPESFVYFLYRIQRPRVKIPCALYQVVYAAKIAAAVLLLANVTPRLALAVLALGFAIEVRVYFKFHTNLMLLVSLILLCFLPDSDALGLASLIRVGGDLRAWFREGLAARGDVFAQVLLVLTVSVMYVATAFRKMNREFITGAVLYASLQATLADRSRRRFSDACYPRWMRDGWIFAPGETLARRWTPIMVLVVALELTLPVLLLTRATQPYAIAAGILMHVGFTVAYPATLLHFSLLTIASYLLFIDPAQLQHWLLALAGSGQSG